MSGAKKITTVFDDQVNAKIQKKFDMVFAGKKNDISELENEEIEFGTGLDDEFVMEKKDASEINLDFSLDDDAVEEQGVPVKKAAASAKAESDDGLDFSLNFDMDDALETSSPAEQAQVQAPEMADDIGGFTLDDSDIGSNDVDESTKKTIMINTADLKKSNLAEFSLETTGSHSTADHMSNEEARSNIESTIKDIIRPKMDETNAFDIAGMDTSPAGGTGLGDIEDSVLDFRENTPSKGFSLDSMDDEAFSIERAPAKPKSSEASKSSNADSTGEFDIDSLDTAYNADEEVSEPVEEAPVQEKVIEREEPRAAASYEATPSMGMGGSNMTSEDGMRFQATIRALREEREEMLAQIKGLKSDSKELEQDNLTLKANLDEAKIEITILRKRHMVELEDLKYRLGLSEEKKAMADEKARQADLRREKLEQKVRIDFNQVKQREKELESKLELLSMDVDSQVHSRDQKILELRRKIDALEFNMENASIKEQKSLDDKRKLEDRLNKIMKTLRHSIKNLEDDIDHAQEDDDHQKEKN